VSAGHTSGPWALSGNSKTWALLDAAGFRIALVDKGGLDAAANARLIAAAPELLEALRDESEFVEMERRWSEASDLTKWIDRCERLEAIIAKAEGRS